MVSVGVGHAKALEAQIEEQAKTTSVPIRSVSIRLPRAARGVLRAENLGRPSASFWALFSEIGGIGFLVLQQTLASVRDLKRKDWIFMLSLASRLDLRPTTTTFAPPVGRPSDEEMRSSRAGGRAI